MSVTVITGEQRGDEGKGRFVDMYAPEFDIVARFNGGNNAGHTVVTPDGREFALHSVPSGIVHEGVLSAIGRGAIINPASLDKEITSIEKNDVEISPKNLKICGGAHLILPLHISHDEAREAGKGAQGSTKSGIAQAYADKSLRLGVRAETIKNDPDSLHELVLTGLKNHRADREALGLECKDEKEIADAYVESAHKLAPYITDVSFYLNQALRAKKRILAEGAQAFLLDIDHGMYPFVTSSNTTAGAVPNGLGIAPRYIDHVIGVSKVVQSHVGGGPFVTEIHDEVLLGQLHGDLTTIDAERGTTTGRTRRLGYLDLPAIRRSQMVNGTDEMAITKLDWIPRFGDQLKVCVAYERKGRTLDIAPDAAYKLEQSTPIYEQLENWDEDIQGVRKFADLPRAAKNFVRFVENETGVPIKTIGVGPKRDQVIEC